VSPSDAHRFEKPPPRAGTVWGVYTHPDPCKVPVPDMVPDPCKAPVPDTVPDLCRVPVLDTVPGLCRVPVLDTVPGLCRVPDPHNRPDPHSLQGLRNRPGLHSPLNFFPNPRRSRLDPTFGKPPSSPRLHRKPLPAPNSRSRRR